MSTHGDRLSALPDGALHRILSHLSTVEATRATALSRRWRRICAGVPVVDLVDGKIGHRDWRQGLPVCFDSQVTGAIFSKGPTTPIRVLRLHARQPPDKLLDAWIAIAASSGAEEIDLALDYRCYSRRRLCPFGTYYEHDSTDAYAKTPRQLFRCPTLRRLRLANWTLDLPGGGVVAESLDTLCLKRIMAPAGQLQQLISACPYLADLTLEQCPTATEITVCSDRLRSFAIVCCHNARRVELRTRCLRSLRYKGALPSDTFFDVPNYGEVAALTIDICEDLTRKDPMEVAPVLDLISRCQKLTYLHLAPRPTMAYYSREFTAIARNHLPLLRHLVLKGSLPADHVVRSVAVLVANTLHLEALSLFLRRPETSKEEPYDDEYDYYDSDSDREPETRDEEEDLNTLGLDQLSLSGPDPETPKMKKTYDFDDGYDDEYYDDDYEDSDPELEIRNEDDDDIYDDGWMSRSMWRWGIPCSRHRLKRINITKYTGNGFERVLANFLLSNGALLEEFSVTLSAPLRPHREGIAMEFLSWRHNPMTIVTCI